MKDRLDKFIKTEGLTPSRFAEIMGVQPSSISHILGGRNKPNYDFIEKFLSRFPKVNPDWLILGKGQIYRQPASVSQISNSQGVEIQRPNDLFATNSVIENKDELSVSQQAPSQKYNSSEHKTSTIFDINESDIERVVIFLKNKTFVSYTPE